MPRIEIVSAHYYADYVGRSLRALDLVTAALPTRSCVVVANQPSLVPALTQQTRERRYVETTLEHDNVGLEFGAYQAGVDYFRRGGEADWLLVVNDTFAIHGDFFRAYRANLIRALEDETLQKVPAVVGKVEFLARSFAIEGLRTCRWVTSSVFALNRSALAALEYRVYCPELERLVQPAGTMDSFFSRELDPVVRERLATWLFGSGPPPHWYAASPLTSQNALRLAQKARCILQEQYLGARLDAASAVFVDLRKLTGSQRVNRWFERGVLRLGRNGRRRPRR